MKRALEITVITELCGKISLVHEETNLQIDCPYHPSKHESFRMGLEMLRVLIDDYNALIERVARRRKLK